MVGALIPFQALINGGLSRHLGSSLQASFVSFIGGFIVLLFACLAWAGGIPSFSSIISARLIFLSGGILGAFFVLSSTVVVPKIGSTVFIALVIVGQLLISLILDHFGVLGIDKRLINLPKIIGVIFLLFGGYLIVNN